jgi:type II secretory pathway pseudopilin PulG
MLLVIIIVAMLAGVLFRTYSTISEITFRLQQEKYLMQDSLLFSQIFQNASDTSQIDYSRYGSGLIASSGLTDILYLKDENNSYAFYTT